MLCRLLDERLECHPEGINRFEELITYVIDRPGHDKRYAIDAGKIKNELGWEAKETFETGLAKTIDWYLDNKPWWDHVRDDSYKGERLGLVAGE